MQYVICFNACTLAGVFSKNDLFSQMDGHLPQADSQADIPSFQSSAARVVDKCCDDDDSVRVVRGGRRQQPLRGGQQL